MGIRTSVATAMRSLADKFGAPSFAATPFPSGGVDNAKQLTTELGGTGTFNFGGFIRNEDPNAEMDGQTSIRNLDEMRRGDAQAHASLEVVKMPIRTATYEVDPSDPEDQESVFIAEFVKWNLFEGMHTNWDDVVRQALLMLDFGFMLFEKVWTVQETGKYAGYITLSKLAPRPPKTIWQWFTDEDGALLSIKQLAVKAGSYQFLDVPASKLVRFTFQQEGDNFLGISMLRSAYPHWLIKKNLYVVDAIRAQRFGVGIPRAKLIQGYRPTEDDKAAIATMLQGMSSHQHSYVIQPAQMEVDILMPQGVRGGADIMPTINHHNEQITRNILAQFLDMGGKAQGGSRALGASAMDFFLNAIEAIAEQFCDVMNKQCIVDLVDMNFPGEKYPTLRPVGIHETDVNQLAQAAAALGGAGFLTGGDRQTENTFRTLMNLPRLADDSGVLGGPGQPGGGTPANTTAPGSAAALPATSAPMAAVLQGPESPQPMDFAGVSTAGVVPAPAFDPFKATPVVTQPMEALGGTPEPMMAGAATPAPAVGIASVAAVMPATFTPGADTGAARLVHDPLPADAPAVPATAAPVVAVTSVATEPYANPATGEMRPATSVYIAPAPHTPTVAARSDLASSGVADEEEHTGLQAPLSVVPSLQPSPPRVVASDQATTGTPIFMGNKRPPVPSPSGMFWRKPTALEERVLALREIPHHLNIARSDLRNTLHDVHEEQILRIASIVAHAAPDATLKAPLVGKMQSDIVKAMNSVFAYGSTQVKAELQKQRQFPVKREGTALADWKEEDHPRDKSGQFANGPDGGAHDGVAQDKSDRQKAADSFKLASMNTGDMPEPAVILGGVVEPKVLGSYLRTHGQEWKASALPASVAKGQPQRCYKNATQLVMDNHLSGDGTLDYVEGLAYVPLAGKDIGFLHAWAVKPDGTVVDPTWDHPEKARYFGVKYNWPEYQAHILNTHTYGVMGGDPKAARNVIATGHLRTADDWKATRQLKRKAS